MEGLNFRVRRLGATTTVGLSMTFDLHETESESVSSN